MNSTVVLFVVLCVLISANTISAVPYHDNVAEVVSAAELEARDKRGITVTLSTGTITTEVTQNVTVPATCYKTTDKDDPITPCRTGRSLTMPLYTLNPATPDMMYRTAIPTMNRSGKESDEMVGQTLLPSFAEEERLLPKGRVFWNIGTSTITETKTVNITVADTVNTVTLIINAPCIPADIESKASICPDKSAKTAQRRPVRRGRSIQEVLQQKFP